MKRKHLKAEALMINAIRGPNNTQVTQVSHMRLPIVADTELHRYNKKELSPVQWQALFKDHVQHKYEKSAFDIHRCISEGWGWQCGLWVLTNSAECKSAVQFLLWS